MEGKDDVCNPLEKLEPVDLDDLLENYDDGLMKQKITIRVQKK